MSKEPIGLYVLRILTALGLFFFMAMLYWSSLLVEENLGRLSAQVEELTRKIEQGNFQKETQSVSHILTTSKSLAQADYNLPNQLTPDPFYEVTLPKLLGPDFQPQGVFRNDEIGRPNNLHPFSNWASVNALTSLGTVSLSTNHFGIYETYAPYHAVRMEIRETPDGKPEFWIHLRNDVYWQPLKKEFFPNESKLDPKFLDKHPVTAHDYKFFWEATMNPYNQEAGALARRTYLLDLEEIRVIDDYTFVVRWKATKIKTADGKEVWRNKYTAKANTLGLLKPLPGYIFKYFPDGSKIVEDDADPDTYRKNSVWAQNFSQHWARNVIPSCGPWTFAGMTDRQIRFQRTKDFFQPLDALALGQEISFKDNFESQWQNFKTNQIDSYELQPDQLLEWENFKNSDEYRKQEKAGEGIKRLDYLGQRYYYIGWNQAKPLFQSRKVRQALTMSIDRERIIKQNLNGLGIEITGTFNPMSTSISDPSIKPWPFDPILARRMLEEEGWYDHDGDGVIDKVIDGKKVDFQFTLTYFVKNALGKAICEFIATSLKEVGIICNLNGVELADLTTSFEDKNFDAIYLGWGLGAPPEDPRQIWSSAGAREKGSSNAVGFVNQEVDDIINRLEFEDNPDKRRELFYRFDAILHEEQPYTFLFAPKVAFLYREYLQNVFIPAERQDLIPGADITMPVSSVFWLKPRK